MDQAVAVDLSPQAHRQAAGLLSVDSLDWASIAAQLDAEGYAVLPGFLGMDAARDMARAMQSMQAASRMPLASLRALRAAFYRHLAVIANRWCETLSMVDRYPAELEDPLRLSRQAEQVQARLHLNRLGVEDYTAFHQRSDDEQRVFPMRIVALLSEPGTDFTGGEFVMTEQRPRMQSRPMVLPLKLGDAAIISTAERPFKGAKGHYRVNMKHAISRVRRGERVGMELSFHDTRGKL